MSKRKRMSAREQKRKRETKAQLTVGASSANNQDQAGQEDLGIPHVRATRARE